MQPMWSALYVIAHHEKKASKFLSAHNVDHYLPVYAERSQWSDRTVLVERPLFPGYLFVRFWPEQRRLVLGAPGAVRLANDKDNSGTFTDTDMERLRKIIARGCGPHLPLQWTTENGAPDVAKIGARIAAENDTPSATENVTLSARDAFKEQPCSFP